nr:twin-arginine translocase TatA/TatE family subunit [Mesonia aquimarina]
MMTLGIFLAFGVWQGVVIAVVILLLFGGKKIPELMKGLGSGLKEFKDASKEDEEDVKTDKKVENNKQ